MVIIMKVCPNCHMSIANDNATFCTRCGADISNVAPQYNTFVQVPPYQPSTPYVAPPKKSFKWSDVCIRIGFISSLVGLFWSSIFLLPIGIICSVIGFIGNKTNGLAIAGMVISIIAFIVKIAVLLNEAGVIPAWGTRGVV